MNYISKKTNIFLLVFLLLVTTLGFFSAFGLGFSIGFCGWGGGPERLYCSDGYGIVFNVSFYSYLTISLASIIWTIANFFIHRFKITKKAVWIMFISIIAFNISFVMVNPVLMQYNGTQFYSAIENRDSSKCEDIIFEPRYKDSCLSEVIWLDRDIDPNRCSDIADPYGGKIIKCYANVADSVNDASTCSNISEMTMRDFCYKKVALRLKNYEICDKITDALQSKKCVEEIQFPESQ